MSDSTSPESENKKQIIKDPVMEPGIRLKTKSLPIIITLLGAGIACVISVIQFTDFSIFFTRLIKAVIFFGIIGVVVKLVLDLMFNSKKISKVPTDSSEETEDEDSLQENQEVETDEVVPEENEVLEESDE